MQRGHGPALIPMPDPIPVPPAETPVELDGLHLGSGSKVAAGLPAVQKTVSLSPNQADLLDLHPVSLGLPADARAELQPVVTLLPTPDGVSTCQVDAEVFGPRTGRTRVLLNPQPLPPRKTPQ